MTNPEGTARDGAGSESSTSGAEPLSGGFEAPPIEQSFRDAPPGHRPPPSAPPGFSPPDDSSSSYPPPAYPPPYPGVAGYGPPYPPPPVQLGYGPPPTGYPAPYTADAYGVPTGKTNSLAIASLVLSLAGLVCGIGSMVGIVLGVVALNQIKRSREGGEPIAIAGIAVGAVTLLISFILIFVMMVP